MAITTVYTYDEMKVYIGEIGFLPLSNLVPGYPSLASLTNPGSWHTDSPETDPWLWRVRLADERVVAYGKFVKKKPVFVTVDLFPYVRSVLADSRPVAKRYQDGLVSRTAYTVFQAIEAHGTIDARELRTIVGMRDKEQKAPFEKAVEELQSSLDIVITGSASRSNDQGEPVGWKSMCFQPTGMWMDLGGIDSQWYERDTAKVHLLQHFERISSEKSLVHLKKLFGLS